MSPIDPSLDPFPEMSGVSTHPLADRESLVNLEQFCSLPEPPADFGAFLEVAEGVEGLLHISEISHRRIDRVDREIREGEVVQVKILSIDPDKGRISLSKKALEERPANDRGRGGGASEARPEDPEMRKLRSKFSGDLKGGLG